MKKMNILVTGSNGQLGSEIRELSGSYTKFNYFFTSRQDLDISDKNAIENFVVNNSINSIINYAAYTAVDKAESEPELADKINHLAVKALAEIALKYDLKLIHISTDYVFDGTAHKPYSETDIPNPQSVYGKTKLDGERVIQKINPANSVIIRTSWVYSSFGNNFVKTMLRLGGERDELNVICDQVGAPTNAADLAGFILSTAINVKNKEVKVVHFTNNGVCSWYDFAREVMELGNLECFVKPISTIEYPTPANRPYYSAMDKTKITTEFDYNILHWKESLKGCLVKLKVVNQAT